jgi:hypothetical protein
MFRVLRRHTPQTTAPLAINQPAPALPQVTFKQKLEELHNESIALQKRFLDVVEKIRENGKSDEAIDEVLLYNRDMLYKKFNRILNMHRKLRNYVMEKNVSLSAVIGEDVLRSIWPPSAFQVNASGEAGN